MSYDDSLDYAWESYLLHKVARLTRERDAALRRVAELEGRNAIGGLRRLGGGDLAAVDSGADRAVREYRG